MSKYLSKILLSGLLAGSFSTLPALAELSPYVPHVYLNGYAGYGASDVQGRGDILQPLYTTNDKNLFLYGQGLLENNTDASLGNIWTASLGAGYRQILGSRIYGAYVFGDYSSTIDNNQYWMVSPGIETLGEIIDFRANGYFPVGTDKWTKSGTPTYIGHETNYDLYEYFTDTESVGPGGDAEIGAKLFSIKHMPVKLFLNGYYFVPDDSDQIKGIGGRLTFQPTRYLTLEVKDSYDNVNHNVVMAGVRLYLNGFDYGIASTHVDDIGMQPRLYDQIERNLAIGGIGEGMTSKVEKVSDGVHPSDYYSVYVINPGSDADTNAVIDGDGTLENPYFYAEPDDMQEILDATNDNYPDQKVRIYFTSPKDEPFLMTPYDGYPDSYVHPYSNQMLWGTTGYDWTMPTASDPYPVDFIGAFSLADVTGVEFHYLAIDNYSDSIGAFANGMSISNSQDILLQSVNIGGGTDEYQTGIAMANDSSIILDDTEVYGVANGMTVINYADITTKNGTVVKGGTAGIELLPDGDGNINMGNFYGDGSGEFEGGIYGLLADTDGNITLGNIENTNFTGGESGSNSYGAFLYAGYSLSINEIMNSTFTGGEANNRSYGAYLKTDGSLTIDNIIDSTFTGGTSGGESYGAFLDSYNSLTIGNIIDSNFTGGKALTGFSYGAYLYGGNNLTIGQIISSTFTGPQTTKGNGLYVTSLDDGSSSIHIKNIYGSTFDAYTGLYLNDFGSGIFVANTEYTEPEPLYNALKDDYNNTFNAATNKVCVNGSCYP